MPMPNSRATSAIVRPSEVRYKSIARALNSGANLLGLVTIQLLPWPNQTKIESLQESGGTSNTGNGPCERSAIIGSPTQETSLKVSAGMLTHPLGFRANSRAAHPIGRAPLASRAH